MDMKLEQAQELARRVRARLAAGPYPLMALQANEIVIGFLVCMEEMAKISSEAASKGR